MDNQPNVEILIHIEAPSRAVDDAHYRSLAAAYLGFEPAGSTHSFSQDYHGSRQHGARRASGTQAPRVPEDDDDESSVIPSGVRLGSFHSPQASFRSVVDNADSPQMHMGAMLGHAPIESTPISATQASWETPPSIVQDSHPMNHTDFTSLTTPTRVLENYLQHFDSPLGSSNRNSPSSGLAAPLGHIAQNAGDETPAEDLVPFTPQVIPRARNMTGPMPGETESLQDSSNPWHQAEVSAISRSDDHIVEETIFISSQLLAPTRADSEPPPKLRQLQLVSNPHTLARTFSDVGPRTPFHPKAPVTVTFLSSHGFTYESLEILPPEPPTSDSHIEPHTLITQGLQKLGDDVNISSCFRPKEQTRELKPFERGYWLLDCSTWEPQLKRDAWAFLANYIGTGIAGWGVRCMRDPDFRELRAYCFGLVTAHIYYVLWLSSQRKIVFTGSSWIDGGGTKVIIMGSRGNPPR